MVEKLLSLYPRVNPDDVFLCYLLVYALGAGIEFFSYSCWNFNFFMDFVNEGPFFFFSHNEVCGRKNSVLDSGETLL